MFLVKAASKVTSLNENTWFEHIAFVSVLACFRESSGNRSYCVCCLTLDHIIFLHSFLWQGAPAPSHHIFEISRGSGSCQMQQFWVAALVFCCLAVRPQRGLFLIGHNRAPRRRQKHCTCFILIETGTQLVGSIGPCG